MINPGTADADPAKARTATPAAAINLSTALSKKWSTATEQDSCHGKRSHVFNVLAATDFSFPPKLLNF
jgi:hypothetical protein